MDWEERQAEYDHRKKQFPFWVGAATKWNPSGLMHYADTWNTGNQAIVWRDPYEFEARLTYHSFGRGRSAAYFIWADEEGNQYPMFMSEVDRLLRLARFEGGSVSGRWSFVKRGSNYSIRLVEAPSGSAP
jgi:hypothetical protein